MHSSVKHKQLNAKYGNEVQSTHGIAKQNNARQRKAKLGNAKQGNVT